MSRIGKKPISIPKGVEVKLDGDVVKAKGPVGSLERKLHPAVKMEINGDSISVMPVVEDKESSKFHGLSRTLVANMVEGVNKGFKKSLSLVGVGYRAAKDKDGVNLTLGYSHPILFKPLPGIKLEVEKLTTIHVSGASKEDVGETAAKIRKLRPPEPYHGKGVRYSDEVIATKAGKTAKK